SSNSTVVTLPAHRRRLVTSNEVPRVIGAVGSKRQLGAYDAASCSPHGLFVAASRGQELFALDPGGHVHWSIARPRPVLGARWSPDGFRIAYRSGGALRLVAGDGTGDRLLLRS